jgi:hypothetical protein
MSSESVCQVARSWVDVGSFHKSLFEVLCFAIASVREFLDTLSYCRVLHLLSYSPREFRLILSHPITIVIFLYRASWIYRVIKMSLCNWWLQNTSFLPHYLAQSDCLAADRQGQGDTRLTLTPSVIPNSNYVIMVSDRNCLKYFCVFLYCNYQLRRDCLIILYKFRLVRLPLITVFPRAVHELDLSSDCGPLP